MRRHSKREMAVTSPRSVSPVVTPPSSQAAEDLAAPKVKGSQMMFRTELQESVESLWRKNKEKS